MSKENLLASRKPRTITCRNIGVLEEEMGKITSASLLEAQFTPIAHAYVYEGLYTVPSDPEIMGGSRRNEPHLISLKPMGSRIMSRVNDRRSIDLSTVSINLQTFDFNYQTDFTQIIERTNYGRVGLAIGILTGHPILGAFIGSNSGVTTYRSEKHDVHIHTPGLILKSNNRPDMGIVPVPSLYGPINQNSFRHFDTWGFPDYERGRVKDWDRTPEKVDVTYQNLLYSMFVLAQEQQMPINLVHDWLNATNSLPPNCYQ